MGSTVTLMEVRSLGCQVMRALDSNRHRGMVVTGTLTRRAPIVFLSRPATFLSFPDGIRVVRLLRRLSHSAGGAVFLSARSLRLTLRVTSGV